MLTTLGEGKQLPRTEHRECYHLPVPIRKEKHRLHVDITDITILDFILGELIKESSSRKIIDKISTLLETYDKDMNILVDEQGKREIKNNIHLQRRYYLLKTVQELITDQILESTPHSAEEKELLLLHAKCASLQKDIRQLLHIIRKNKENKTCTTLKQQTHISFKQKQSLFSFIKKKQQIISDHLATTSPLKKEKSSVIDHFLQEDFKLFVQSYEQLMRERAKKHNWTTDNEKELLSIIFSFTADVRFYLFYILDYAPKDLSIDQEKHKIEEPRVIMNHLYECPITHLQGEKNDLDIHHGLKQSWMYGSMKENIMYIRREFHTLIHIVTDHHKLEAPIVKVKNILAMKQGLSSEEFTKPSSPLIKYIHELENLQTQKGVGKIKNKQLAKGVSHLMITIDRLRTLPQQNEPYLEQLQKCSTAIILQLTIHFNQLIKKFPKEIVQEKNIKTLYTEIHKYIKKDPTCILSEKEFMSYIHTVLLHLPTYMNYQFSHEHPKLSQEEWGWYAMQQYNILKDLLRITSSEISFLLEKNIIRKIVAEARKFQKTFITTIGHIDDQYQKGTHIGHFKRQMTKVSNQEKNLFEYMIEQLCMSPQEIRHLLHALPQSTITSFIVKERQNIPYFIEQYRDQILAHGIPYTLLHNHAIALEYEGSNKMNPFILQSLPSSRKL